VSGFRAELREQTKIQTPAVLQSRRADHPGRGSTDNEDDTMKPNSDPIGLCDSPAAETRLISATPPSLRKRVRAALTDPNVGGRGLRAWLALVEFDDRPIPENLPADLFAVYLSDAEAEPLHDCERCGLPVPVRVARRSGHEPTCDREYFACCPRCGGRTGRHAFWSRNNPA
jgi:hypothetical protein